MHQTMHYLLRPMSHGRYADAGLLILRFTSGFFMAYVHGWDKLANFTEYSKDFYDFLGLGFTISLGLAVFSEFFCGLFLMVGLGTRLAAFPLFITMAVIVFDLNWGNKVYEYESALLYMINYLILCLTGAGRYSLDYKFFGGGGKKSPAA